VKQTRRHRIRKLTRWVCVLAVLCGQASLFTLRAAAQEPTTEPTSLPTPTPAPTWTPIPTPTNTPNPAVTPTANPTAAARTVDFRVDEDEIIKGDCVMFSWLVRGDIDRVEFDQIGDGKVPLLVSDMDSRQECPEEETTYELVVTWLDSTETTRSIEIEVDADGTGDGGGDNGASGGTPTPGGTATFVYVTPIPIATTPVSAGNSTPVQGASGGVVVTPVGALGSVKVLPETGYLSPYPDEKKDTTEDDLQNRGPGLELAVSLVTVLAVVVISSALGIKVIQASEAPNEE
jgi:hypothetical protein